LRGCLKEARGKLARGEKGMAPLRGIGEKRGEKITP